MFRSNRPSSRVQVAVMKESATHCNAVLFSSCNFFGFHLVMLVNLNSWLTHITKSNSRQLHKRIKATLQWAADSLNHNNLYTWRWPVRPKQKGRGVHRRQNSKRQSHVLMKHEPGSKKNSACLLANMLHAGFLLCIFFDSEEGSDMLLRNVSWFSMDYPYTELHPRVRPLLPNRSH
jgi:hypothetical protein